MRDLFDVPVGLSDHTIGIGASIASVSLGACLVERHFKSHADLVSPDSAFSLDPDQFSLLQREIVTAHQAIGKANLNSIKSESASIKLRRSIYIVNDLRKGDKITRNNIKIIRPSNGLETKYLDIALGREVTRDITCRYSPSFNHFTPELW